MIRHSVPCPLLFRLLVFVAPALVLAHPAKAHAGYVQQNFVMDQSNVFADGITYGHVKVEANDTAGPLNGLAGGAVRLTVTIDTPAVYGPIGKKFGMDKFAFNTDLHLLAGQISGPSGWSLKFDKNMDGFGEFSVRLAGGGKNRLTTGIFTISGLGTNATLAHFEIGSGGSKKKPPQGSVYFAAHVADFGEKCDEDEGSNFIGGGIDPGNQSPEPTTLSLGLLGVAGLGVAQYLRRKQSLRPRTA
jgi:hypothetical protein